MLFFSFNPFTDWLSSPSFLSVFDLDWPQPKPQLQQNLPQPRPPTAKPKDPDSYDFGGNEEAAKDYRYDKKSNTRQTNIGSKSNFFCFRKLWDKYNEMEAMLKKQAEGEAGDKDEEQKAGADEDED